MSIHAVSKYCLEHYRNRSLKITCSQHKKEYITELSNVYTKSTPNSMKTRTSGTGSQLLELPTYITCEECRTELGVGYKVTEIEEYRKESDNKICECGTQMDVVTSAFLEEDDTDTQLSLAAVEKTSFSCSNCSSRRMIRRCHLSYTFPSEPEDQNKHVLVVLLDEEQDE